MPRTPSGKQLAQAALTTPADSWWHDIAAAYGTTQRRATPAAPDRREPDNAALPPPASP